MLLMILSSSALKGLIPHNSFNFASTFTSLALYQALTKISELEKNYQDQRFDKSSTFSNLLLPTKKTDPGPIFVHD